LFVFVFVFMCTVSPLDTSVHMSSYPYYLPSSYGEERKLFIGMLSKTMKEDELRDMFLPFGSIEELTILRNPDGTSKGCSFLKFTQRSAALNAINAMHNSRIMEGASSPLVVKFADTEKDKMMRRMNSSVGLVYAGFPAMAGSVNQYAMYQQQMLQQQALMLQGLIPGQSTIGASAIPEGALVGGQSPAATAGLFGNIPMAISFNPQLAALNMQASRVPQKEGPEGANLFIYHLPQEFTDSDLFQTFGPFGNVISAKVFVDKVTNLSKCFGFVSYDNAISAQAAINAMNGFQIGMKRLKVQLKRAKDTSKPY